MNKSCREFHTYWAEGEENKSKLYLWHSIKYESGHRFLKNYVIGNGDSLYRIPLKNTKRCWNYGYSSICKLEKSVSVTELIFTKLTLAWQLLVKIFPTEYVKSLKKMFVSATDRQIHTQTEVVFRQRVNLKS